MNKNKRKSIKVKLAAVIAAVMMAMPFGAYAEEMTAVQKIHHVHVGSSEEGGACYEKEVKHVHEGSGENGGDCFRTPVYHAHEGSASKGGACYQTEIFHTHKGTEANGKGCYGEPVYHQHDGSINAGGGCYKKPLYHSHTGSSAGGGCYGKPVYHSHTGSSAGSGCYGTPVYHQHTGSASGGGGCYITPVYHNHTGSEVSGGGCYSPVYHQHSDACYEEKLCVAEYVSGLTVIRTWTEYCYHHKNTQHAAIGGIFRHTACGAGDKYEEESICWACQILKVRHNYSEIICGKTTDTVEGYERTCGKDTNSIESMALGCGKNESSIEQYGLSCGKNEQTVDSYQINCNKNESTIDSYALNCNKTESSIENYSLNCGRTEEDVDAYELDCEKDDKTIDGYALSCDKTNDTVDSYELSCEKNEEDGYAELFIINKTAGWTDGKVVLQASYKDEQGFLELSNPPFIWEGDGIEGENGDEVEVSSNGIYRVRLNVGNDDISQEELVCSLEVKNMDFTPPVIEEAECIEKDGIVTNILRITAKDLQPDGTEGSGLAEEAYSFDGGKTWQQKNEMELEKNGEIFIAVRDICGNISVRAVEVSHIIGEKEPEGDGNGTDTENEDNIGGGTGDGEDTGNGDGTGDGEDTGNGDGTGDGEDTGNGDGTGDGENTGNGDGTGGGTDTGNGNDSGDGGNSENNKDEGTDSGSGENSGQGGNSGSSGNAGKNHLDEEDGKKLEDSLEKDKQLLENNKQPLKKKGDSSRKDGNGKENGKARWNRADEYEIAMPKKNETAITDEDEGFQKETGEIEAAEAMAGPQAGERLLMAKRAETVEKVVKAVTFTVSGIMLAAGLLYLIYLMFRSIQIFDCDGEGNTKYAGSCIMKKTEEGFEVRIPDMIWEHSATGQYSLKPGKLFAKRNKGKELIVMMGNRKEAVWIDKEIPLRVSVCA